MATIIGKPKLEGGKVPGTPDTYELTVTYTAKFSPFEVQNFKFREGFVLWDEDGLTDDDMLTGVVGVSVFDPSQQTVTRTMKHRISGDTLDTDLGAEELYAIVRLRNLGINCLVKKRSTILPLSP